jgi:hypothetical protein
MVGPAAYVASGPDAGHDSGCEEEVERLRRRDLVPLGAQSHTFFAQDRRPHGLSGFSMADRQVLPGWEL